MAQLPKLARHDWAAQQLAAKANTADLGTAATTDATDYAAAARGAYPVQQVTLTGNLAYTLPADAPADQVISVVFTQDATGGHTVTYGGSPVTVDTTAGASTLVEVWPGGTLVYPGASAPSGTSSAITADDTPAAPAEGESASYFVTSAVTWPVGLVWSTDPDGGVAPTITGTALVSLFTLGGTTRAILGATFPGVASLGDTTAPVWTATFTMGTPTQSSVVATASALATDANAFTYEVSYDNAATWAAIVPSGSNFTLAGSAGVTYATTKLRAKDAAGNYSTPVLSVPSYTMAASADVTAPTVGTMAASAITSSGFTLTVSGASDAGAGLHATPYAFTTNNADYSAYQASAVYTPTGLTASTGYSCNWRVRDAAGNVSTGTAQTVTTTAPAQTFEEYVTSLSPLFYIPLDDAVGTTSPRKLGSAQPTLTASNVTFGGAPIGSAPSSATFNGTSSKITSAANYTALEGLTAFTLFAHVDLATLTATSYLFGLWGGTGMDVQYTALGRVGVNGTVLAPSPSVAVDADTFIVGTYDGSNYRIYTNGTAGQVIAAAGVTTATVSKPLQIGAFNGVAAWLSGRLARVGAFNRALTAGEVATLSAKAVA